MTSVLNIVKVGIADLNIVKAPDLIRTTGLGSCVGVVIYDKARRIAGMAHVMLPDSALGKQGLMNKAKYGDTAVKELTEILVANGARLAALQAKLAGGAQMFQFSGSSDVLRIGPRNVESVLLALKKLNIPVTGQDVGGNNGRTIEFSPETCILSIRTINKGNSEL
ncbi:chemotaxis protein CheD [Mesobacillus foraminis]|uniref:Probable chemoreceptor glutamine deamidase CheD n=1 Tax=Mesobacillus foraminis TaxID=279826 RepID=A0A4R2BFL7_9BACI|nr:chemotaxis protein CheD [Mesobacillus foraminis]TCN25596.1 chemotaxis protein CheD [Mesobacillus foraminis]